MSASGVPPRVFLPAVRRTCVPQRHANRGVSKRGPVVLAAALAGYDHLASGRSPIVRNDVTNTRALRWQRLRCDGRQSRLTSAIASFLSTDGYKLKVKRYIKTTHAKVLANLTLCNLDKSGRLQVESAMRYFVMSWKSIVSTMRILSLASAAILSAQYCKPSSGRSEGGMCGGFPCYVTCVYITCDDPTYNCTYCVDCYITPSGNICVNGYNDCRGL